MLYSLTVSNYILIGSLETRFPEGLVIISGETGAGKSILLGALSLVLGAKAEAGMVGPHSDSCVVEAEFGLDEDIRTVLADADLPAEGDRLILRRTVARSGRSRSFANDEPVSVNVLQELATRLVDIHSQHQTLRLSDQRFRMEALDLWAGASAERKACTAAWTALQEGRRELASLQERLTRARQEQEYNQARWEQLDRAQLREGELEELESEQKQLAHAEEIKENLYRAQHLLSPENEEALSQRLRECARMLEKAGAFLPELQGLAARLASARLEVEDIAAEIATANERTDASPERLQTVEERLSLLYELMQRYGAASVEELIAGRNRLESLVTDATQLLSQVESARKAVEEKERLFAGHCERLHRLRKEGTPGFASAIQEQLHALELDHALFRVELEDCTPGADGGDSIRFLFSSTGHTPADVAKTASGGELSRIMLSIKAVMARFTHMPTLIFDEIDSGVSGSTADKMGSLVCAMGTEMQVFAITHLPQVAAKGNAHYLVSKSGDLTSVRCLDDEGRVQELARMLSGSTITPAAIANAKALLHP